MPATGREALILASVGLAFAALGCTGPAAAQDAPAPAAAPSWSLPPEPSLAPARLAPTPASFCSETERVKYLNEEFNPTAAAASANASTTADYLNQLDRAAGSAPTREDIIAAGDAFKAYKPKADEAYKLSLDILALRPSIMAVPVAPCGAPVRIAEAPPPPPPRLAADAVQAAVRPAQRQAPGPSAAAMAMGRPIGPKRTIAVGAINASGGFEQSESWSAGPALTAMLTKTLGDTGRFIMVERSDLTEVLNEKQLKATHVSGGEDAGPPTKMIPAQFLVVGSVTEFGAPNQGGGISVGGLGLGPVTGGLGLRRQTGKVSIDLRIVNPRTGEDLYAFTVTRQASSTSLAVTADYRGVSTGGDTFSKTPLGEASRLALTEAAQRISDFVSQASWEGRVVAADDDGIFVNAGSEAGLSSGDRLRVERIGRTLTDPDTGQILSQRKLALGEVVISDVEPKVAHGQFNATQPGLTPQRGDLVIFEGP